MEVFLYLIPITIAMSLAGLAVFFWTLSSDQYEDLDAKARSILFDDKKKEKENGAAGED